MTTENRVSPSEHYTQALMSGDFQPDADQASAISALDDLWKELVKRYDHAQNGLGLRRFRRQKQPKGVYMWGGVGRGKTWMMDMFYDSIPFRRKMRMHFHHFMQRVHKELNSLQGQPDPLKKVADIIYDEAVIICFDEFFVSHVSDAMILGDLFTLLFEKGITLVATSNIEPSGLYKDGLHRDRFLPAITVLEQHTQVMNIDLGIDYRLRVLQQAKLYVSPLTEEADKWIGERFSALTNNNVVSQDTILVNDRDVETRGHIEDILWCDFRQLCMQPRSAVDFIELAQKYNTILVSNVPKLDDNLNDPARRFIYLVDEFYDRRVKLIITATQPILEIYSGKKLAFEIERTRSRLLEMQSQEYLAEPHRAEGTVSSAS